MSNTNRVGLRISEETVTYGQTDPTPTLDAVPFSGSSDLGYVPETIVSELIRSDRQISDLILVGGTVGGQFDSELANTIHDAMIQAMLFSDANFGDNPETTVTANDITMSAPAAGLAQVDGTTVSTTGWQVGDWVNLSGWVSSPSNNGYFEVSNVLSGTSFVIKGADDVVVDGGGDTVTIRRGDKLTNGSTERSFTMERTYEDQVPVLYEYLRGMLVGTFSLSASASSIVQCSFGFLGATQEYTETEFAGAVKPAVPSFTVYDAANSVGSIQEGGVNLGPDNYVMEASIEVENNLRERKAVGVSGASSVGIGEFGVTGNLQTYFDSKALADKLVENSSSSFSVTFTTPSGAALVFHLPNIKFSEGVPEVSGKNDDVMLNLGYQALLDPTLLYTMSVSRFA